jgi:PAS domain S-box-containing protein
MDSEHSLRAALVTELESLYKEISELTRSNTVPEPQLQLLRGLVSISQFAAQQTAQQQSSGGALLAEITTLKEEVERLKAANHGYEKQLQWLKDRIALSRTTTGQLRLKTTLKQTLDTAVAITHAETGSIFLLDEHRVVTESLLSRIGTTEEERHSLVGKVLEKGLAGWVAQHHTYALVPDAPRDQRWIDLPEQPYTVGSVLCVPLLRDDQVHGILTLTHPQAKHFTQQDCDLMLAIAYQMALVLENAHLTLVNEDLTERLQHSQDYFRQLLKSPIIGTFLLQNNKFVHVNKKLAELFNYPREELLKLPSIASVLAYEDRQIVTDAIYQCLTGKAALLNLAFGINQKQGQVVKVMAQGITTEYQGHLALAGIMAEVTSP